jgi:lysozyme family protein
MADFELAYQKTAINEGGYANNPKDKGGETAFGWARNFWPALRVWPIIDSYKKRFTKQPCYGTESYSRWVKEFNKALRSDAPLMTYIKSAYKTEFWDKNRLGEIESQEVAEWIYDHAVNAGGRGVKWIQLAARVTPDGSMGPNTITAINAMQPLELMKRAADIAGAYRMDKAHDDPSQISFLIGWLKRDGQPESILEHVRQLSRDGKLDDMEVALIKAEMEVTGGSDV